MILEAVCTTEVKDTNMVMSREVASEMTSGVEANNDATQVCFWSCFLWLSHCLEGIFNLT